MLLTYVVVLRSFIVKRCMLEEIYFPAHIFYVPVDMVFLIICNPPHFMNPYCAQRFGGHV
jgi:hypothetical protein